MNVLDFIVKHQPVTKATVLDAMGKQIDALVADGTLVAKLRPSASGEVLFYCVADKSGYPFHQEWLDRQIEPLLALSKPKKALPLEHTRLAGKEKLF